MKKRSKLAFINKYLFIFVLIILFIAVRYTYSYLAYKYENTSVIKGNVISVNLEMTVDLVVGNNRGMVPLKDSSLGRAINGTGGKSACVDANGNLSCQVYKITLNNKGSKVKNLMGTISLYNKDSSSTFSNLKWRELASQTEVIDGSEIHGMDTSTLMKGLTMASGETKVYYIAVYIQETGSDQKNLDKGNFAGRVTVTTADDKTNTLTNVISKNAKSDSGIDFSAISSDTNGKGVYVMSGTQNDAYPIYYYRGAVTDNNVLFAGMCFKIVRTTESGGVKLIYNGKPSGNTCNNTGDDSQIGTKAFNSNTTSLTYVGYMYGTPYSYTKKLMSGISENYVYGNSVTYSGGVYTLNDTITNSWTNIYNQNAGIYNHHYTCLSTGNTCSNVYYIYATKKDSLFYITLKNGKNVKDALSDMLDNNITSSVIKGNKDTTGTVDNWYYTNIEQKGYSKYLEDTIWCNDRSIYSNGGWNPNGGATFDPWTSYAMLFSAYNRVVNLKKPSLSCARNIDKFTVNSSNGNGALDYPVGLLTADEMMLAGGNVNTANSNFYLYTGKNYYGMSPNDFSDQNAYEFALFNNGRVYYEFSSGSGGTGIASTQGVRPAISLKTSISVGGGDGTSSNPYTIDAIS